MNLQPLFNHLKEEHGLSCTRQIYLVTPATPQQKDGEKVETVEEMAEKEYPFLEEEGRSFFINSSYDKVQLDNRRAFMRGYNAPHPIHADLISREEVVGIVEQQIYKYESEAEEDESIIGYSDKKSKSEALTDLLEKFRR